MSAVAGVEPVVMASQTLESGPFCLPRKMTLPGRLDSVSENMLLDLTIKPTCRKGAQWPQQPPETLKRAAGNKPGPLAVYVHGLVRAFACNFHFWSWCLPRPMSSPINLEDGVCKIIIKIFFFKGVVV